MKQASAGRMFAFEHPAGASSWQLALVNRLLRPDGAEQVSFDFCAQGMTIDIRGVQVPVKETTAIVTNSRRLASALRRSQCSRDHVHADALGCKIKQCQVYPDKFCEMVCREVMADTGVADPRDVTAELNMLMSIGYYSSSHEEVDQSAWSEELYADKTFFDDISGKELNQ